VNVNRTLQILFQGRPGLHRFFLALDEPAAAEGCRRETWAQASAKLVRIIGNDVHLREPKVLAFLVHEVWARLPNCNVACDCLPPGVELPALPPIPPAPSAPPPMSQSHAFAAVDAERRRMEAQKAQGAQTANAAPTATAGASA
jgi:hypothetical protein